MKAPLKWLKDYVSIDVGVKDYVNAMTLSGSKVEGVEDMGKAINKVVVAKILEIEKHPDADKLRICKVDAGSEILQIVTGAPNVQAGDFIPLALVGAKLPGMEIKLSKLRGVESQGMMCSIDELQLTKDYLPDAPEHGVYVFSGSPVPGTDVKDALDLDQVVEFEITSNRPDCLCILGLARETAVTLGVPLKKPPISIKEEAGEDANSFAAVDIANPELCPRYAARIVTDVVIKPSPVWMQRRLSAAGMRPINNIVDITNYVMLELGQPMHAFDLDQLSGKKILVRTAKPGETIKTLDGQDRKLDESMLVIADGEKPVAVAGVMGGENSEVTSQTRRLLLESANFNGTSIRITGKKMGLRSEASSRFEKGLDPENVLTALDRCAQLIELTESGKVVGGVVDCQKIQAAKRTIRLDPGKINEFLGTQLDTAYMVDIFKSLEFNVDPETLILEVPSFRSDIEWMADLAEEVARFHGYNNIKPSLLSGKESTQGRKTYKQQMEDVIRNTMTGCGLNEAYTLSFTSPKQFDAICLPQDHALRNAVVISNPLGEDYSIMRTTTLPDMLKVLSTNYNRKMSDVGLFELSYVYLPVEDQKLPYERSTLTIGLYGKTAGFFELKGIVEQLLETMHITEVEFCPEANDPSFHPGRTAKMQLMGPDGAKTVAILGEVHPEVAENFECPECTYVAIIDVEPLIVASQKTIQFKPLPKFPAVSRDLAIVVRETKFVADLVKAIREKGGDYLEDVRLFDIYKGSQVPEGMKSVAFALTFRALERTLKDEDVNQAMSSILKHLEQTVGAQLR